MSAKVYSIYLVPNGRLCDFERGIFGNGYPDACKCWGRNMSLAEVRQKYRELADENFRRDGGEYDRIWNECAEKNPEQVDEGFSEPEVECEKYLDNLTKDDDPLNWARIEWNDDLKWVCIQADELGTLFVCDKQGNNAEPLNPNDKPYTKEDALLCDVDPEGLGFSLRETVAGDDVAPSVDYVSADKDGNIVGYFKWVPST